MPPSGGPPSLPSRGMHDGPSSGAYRGNAEEQQQQGRFRAPGIEMTDRARHEQQGDKDDDYRASDTNSRGEQWHHPPHQSEELHAGERNGKSGKRRQHRCLLGCGIVSLVLGVVSLAVTILSVTTLPGLRDRKFLSAVMVTSPGDKGFGDWVGSGSGSSSHTPVYSEYTFFSIQNPTEFVQEGQAPKFKEFGPYVFSQRTRKASVTFSEDRTTVSYVTLTANDYEPDLSGPGLSLEGDLITLVNMPYVTAVATAGSEMDMLRVGTSTGLVELKRRFFGEFLPTLRENAVAMAVPRAVTMMQDTLSQLFYPEGGVALRWGGGCVKLGRINHCGFGSIALISQLLTRDAGDDLELFSLCLETGLDLRTALPLGTVQKLWDSKDELGMFNIDRQSSTVRYGISYWLWGDDGVKERIKAHFNITEQQFQILRQYLQRIYNSPLLEKYVLRYFIAHLGANERPVVTPEMKSWESLVWRQWAVGDVIQVLNGYVGPESVNPEDPPEFAWYMASVGQNISDFNTSRAVRWSNMQAECFFNATTLNSSYYQHEVLGLPRPRSRRTPFNHPELREEPLPHRLDECLPGDDALALARGYIDYVALRFVKPVFERDVLQSNGGLVVAKSAAGWLYGRQEPVLKLALDSDDPRARLFAFMGPKDEEESSYRGGPPRCLASSDLENSYSACKLVLEQPPQQQGTSGNSNNHRQLSAPLSSTVVGTDGHLATLDGGSPSSTGSSGSQGSESRYYVKVPNTYYTGAHGQADRIGSLHLWHGDATAWGIWPTGDIPITGGARKAGSQVQYGYSEGTQFPPLNAVSPTSAPFLLVFLAKFSLPLRFLFSRHVRVRDIDLLRYRLDPLTFSPDRPDASLYSMAGLPRRPGLFNLTDTATAPAYLSPIRYAGTPTNAELAGIDPPIRLAQHLGPEQEEAQGDVEEGEGESFLDVEPYTGRTMNVRISMQLSTAVTPGSYSLWHPNVHDTPLLPVMAMTQRATVGDEDAHFFKSMVYGSAKMIDTLTYASLGAGLCLVILGAVLLIVYAAKKGGDDSSSEGQDEDQQQSPVGSGSGGGAPSYYIETSRVSAAEAGGDDGLLPRTPKSLEMVDLHSSPRAV